MLDIMEQELRKGVQPGRLAYLSFTVQARREALARATSKFGLTEEDLPHFRTLHAICYRALSMTVGGMVRGTWDLKPLAERLGLSFTYRMRHGNDEMLEIPGGQEVGDRLLQFDHVRRHKMLDLETAWAGVFDDDLNIFQVRRFVQAYTDWKQDEGKRDFTDLLEEAQDPLDVDVVIVDEAQDLSRLQWHTLHRLTKNARRMYIAGDDDQAIYTWAGADPTALLQQPGKVQVLGQSYRVPQSIYLLAKSITDLIQVRQPKQWSPRPWAGSCNIVGDVSRVQFNEQPGTWLLLYRHHYQAADFEELVRTQGLPYTRADKPAPGREWGHAIIFWERLRKGQEVTWYAVKTIMDAMAKGHGFSEAGLKSFSTAPKREMFSMARLREDFGLSTTAPWFEALTKIMPQDEQYLRQIISKQGSKALTQEPKIRLSTIHAAKGAEADHVILMTDMSSRTREVYEKDPDVERRVFYVGVTRAKESLTVVGGNNPLFR